MSHALVQILNILTVLQQLCDRQVPKVWSHPAFLAVGNLLSKLPVASSSDEDFSLVSPLSQSANQRPSRFSFLGFPSLSPGRSSSPSPSSPRRLSLPGTNQESSSSWRKHSFSLDPVRKPLVQSSLAIFTPGFVSSRRSGPSQGEMANRLKKLLQMATDFVQFTSECHF